MTVHQIINSLAEDLGGAERLVARFSDAPQFAGLDVRLFSLQLTRGPAGRSPYGVICLLRLCWYIYKRVRPGDLIHAHLFPAGLYVSLLRFLAPSGCRFLYTEHNTRNRRRGTRIGSYVDTIMYDGFDTILAISDGVKDELLCWKPDLVGKVKTVPNGISLNNRVCPERAPKSHLKVLSVGRLVQQKNFETALLAVSQLADLDFEYLIAGSGELMEDLRRQTMELGLSRRVVLLGHVADVPNLLMEVDVFLIPSLWEGFGLAQVEAMNAGLPSVVADVPGLRELIQGDEQSGLLVDPSDPTEIAAALRELLTRPGMRKVYGENAFRRSLSFDENRMFEGYAHVYRTNLVESLS